MREWEGAFLWDAEPAASAMISVLLCLGKRIEKFPLVRPSSTCQPQGSPWPAETSDCLRSSIPKGSWGCRSVVSAGLACVRRGVCSIPRPAEKNANWGSRLASRKWDQRASTQPDARQNSLVRKPTVLRVCVCNKSPAFCHTSGCLELPQLSASAVCGRGRGGGVSRILSTNHKTPSTSGHGSVQDRKEHAGSVLAW